MTIDDDLLLTEVEGPSGTAEIYEVTLASDRPAGGVLEVEYAVVFAGERQMVPSMGEAHLLANRLTGLDEEG